MRLLIKTVFLCISLVLGILSFLVSIAMLVIGVNALSSTATVQFFSIRPFGSAKEFHLEFHSASDVYLFTTCAMILLLISVSSLYLTYRKLHPHRMSE